MTPEAVCSVLDTLHIAFLCGAMWWATVTGKYFQCSGKLGCSLTINFFRPDVGTGGCTTYTVVRFKDIYSDREYLFTPTSRQISVRPKSARGEIVSERIRTGVYHRLRDGYFHCSNVC